MEQVRFCFLNAPSCCCYRRRHIAMCTLLTLRSHFYVPDNVSAVAAALHGGVDHECGNFFEQFLVEALDQNKTNITTVQRAAARTLRPAFLAGIFDDPTQQPYLALDARNVDTLAHRVLAFEAAVQSIVLLKNDAVTAREATPQTMLPLLASALFGKAVAIVGPNANVTQTLLSNYHGENVLVESQSLLSALRRRGESANFSVTHAPGCAYVSCNDTSGFGAAVAAVSTADAVLLVLGTCSDDCGPDNAGSGAQEGEGTDRVSLRLPGLQADLLEAVAAAAHAHGVSVCLVLVHGGPLAVDSAARDPRVPAIVSAHFPGQAGGDAVMAVLFGDVSPSGRTTMSWYASEYETERPLVIDNELGPHIDALGEHVAGITHLYYNGSSLLWPFGTGLSYTNFTFEWLDRLDRAFVIPTSAFSDENNAVLTFRVNVTNHGPAVSDVSAIALWSSGVDGDPIQEVFDFGREAAVKIGESRTMVFTLPPAQSCPCARAG